MLGSDPKEFKLKPLSCAQLFNARVAGHTLWGWERRSHAGELVARSGHLFPDYVTCLCDAERHV